MKVKVRRYANRLTASASDLAADYKYHGLNKYEAWDRFIRDRGLKPEMNAKEFYAIFESVMPCQIDREVEIEFTPTHIDTLLGVYCQIVDDEEGVHNIVWAHGVTGTCPPNDPTFEKRFVNIQMEANHEKLG